VFAIRPFSAGNAATLVIPAGDSGLLGAADEDVRAFAAADPPTAADPVRILPRPLRTPGKVLIVHVAAGDEGGWRAAGAAAARAVALDEELQVALPDDASPEAVRGLAEGLSGWAVTDSGRRRNSPGRRRSR
jgi:leucyl aminopeptidase